MLLDRGAECTVHYKIQVGQSKGHSGRTFVHPSVRVCVYTIGRRVGGGKGMKKERKGEEGGDGHCKLTRTPL